MRIHEGSFDDCARVEIPVDLVLEKADEKQLNATGSASGGVGNHTRVWVIPQYTVLLPPKSSSL